MQIRSLSSSLTDSGADCLIIFVSADGQIQGGGTDLDNALEGKLSEMATSSLLGKDAGSSLVLPISSDSANAVLLYRLGKAPIASEKYCTSVDKLAATLLALKSPSAAVDLAPMEAVGKSSAQLVSDVCAALSHQSYRFENYKSKKKPARALETIHLGHTELGDVEETVTHANSLSEGISLCRDLGNMPGNECTPRYLAECAEKLGNELPVNVEILDEDQMRELGMGSLLSVGTGSVEPSRLVVMNYQGADEGTAPHVLVGKGITFDTGGISLKPGAGMDEMKYDMCGAASVFGAVHAVASMKLPVNLIGIIAAAENMPSGIATKPGDIVTSMSGKTIEVLNTDAEGRLVLCDALTYAERFNPAAIIDIATLTGAVIIALGRHASGMYANDDELAEALQAAASKTEDKIWRMPLWKEYVKQLESPFADLANIGGRDAGSVTAACFLSQFTEKQKWAHLDVAGTAWKTGKAKGATGRPVKLLVEYIKSVAE